MKALEKEGNTRSQDLGAETMSVKGEVQADPGMGGRDGKPGAGETVGAKFKALTDGRALIPADGGEG